MTENQTARRNPARMRQDMQVYASPTALEVHPPANPTSGKEALIQFQRVIQDTAGEGVNAANALAMARDTLVAAGRDFDSAIPGILGIRLLFFKMFV